MRPAHNTFYPRLNLLDVRLKLTQGIALFVNEPLLGFHKGVQALALFRELSGAAARLRYLAPQATRFADPLGDCVA